MTTFTSVVLPLNRALRLELSNYTSTEPGGNILIDRRAMTQLVKRIAAKRWHTNVADASGRRRRSRIVPETDLAATD